MTVEVLDVNAHDAKTNDATTVEAPQTRPLNVMFAITSMPVGGAETLLVNLVRRLSSRFRPQICCLKEPGPLGLELADDLPVHSHLLRAKWDLRVLPRLSKLLRKEKIDALVTVGAGDKMFWGRLAARLAKVPVVLSALHSTGWPDGVGRLNRWLTSITDGFIAVAEEHGRFLVDFEKFPRDKVFVIPNGVDVDRFRPDAAARQIVRDELGLSAETPLAGIVAALRPEKNHLRFLEAAKRVHQQLPDCHFLIVGDGPERMRLEQYVFENDLTEQVHFLGTRSDIPRLLAALDLFALTSDNEANPVSILEAMASGVAVVATDVGSVRESVQHETSGFLVSLEEEAQLPTRWFQVLGDPQLAAEMGQAGRAAVEANWSLQTMVSGYEDLIENVFREKRAGRSNDSVSS